MTVSFGRRDGHDTQVTPHRASDDDDDNDGDDVSYRLLYPLELSTGLLLRYRRSVGNKTEKGRQYRLIGSWTSRLARSKVRRRRLVRP